jgi:hypothetical protein
MSHANSDLPPKTTKQNSAGIVAYMNLPRRKFQVFPCYSRGLYFPISFLSTKAKIKHPSFVEKDWQVSGVEHTTAWRQEEEATPS